MEALQRRTLQQLVDFVALGNRSTVRKLPGRRTIWTRELSTGSSTAVSIPWHHRIGSAASQTLRQAPRPQTRRFTTKFTAPLRSPPKRSFHSSKSRRSTKNSAKDPLEDIPEAKLTISQRLKKLSREYGWTAVGVYLALSVLDFPFCFLLVRTVGTDRIARAEEWLVSRLEKAVPQGVKERWHDYKQALKDRSKETVGEEVTNGVEMAGWGVKEAEERNKTEASRFAPLSGHGSEHHDTNTAPLQVSVRSWLSLTPSIRALFSYECP